uniref:Uncharacterized LOC113896588 n=1 Tax=Bos indicus x Bos taurus TaxID=30522 RepID=A0A4W2INM2_BOBOX
MQQAAPSSLLLACSLALAPFLTVSWEIKVNDFDEKDVNKFQSNGYQCPTCFAVMGRKCNADLKWCRADKLQCVEFSGIINTAPRDSQVEMLTLEQPFSTSVFVSVNANETVRTLQSLHPPSPSDLQELKQVCS